VLATEDRLQRDLLDELLADGPLDAAALAGRAARLGYDFELPHLGLVVTAAYPDDRRNGHDPAAALARAAELLDREADGPEAAVLVRLRDDRLTALLPLRAEADERVARSVGLRLHALLAAQVRPLVASVGLAGPHTGPDGLRTAQREAERALALGGRLFGPGHLTHFGDLGLYRLLFRLHDTPEAAEFYHEALGRLEAYDRQHGADLLPTLEAYFAAGASPKETAARLHLHRNTVLYRLQRIAEISGHRLDDPQTCLSLQLALRLRQTLSPEPGSAGALARNGA
jgi:purine catabolism regulator